MIHMAIQVIIETLTQKRIGHHQVHCLENVYRWEGHVHLVFSRIRSPTPLDRTLDAKIVLI